MSKVCNRLSSSRKNQRRGAAFLILVAIVAMVVLTATHLLIRSEVSRRKHHQDWMRAETMLIAMDSVSELGEGWDDTVRLPLGSGDEEYLEVRRIEGDDRARRAIEVRWMRRGEMIDQAVRNER